jgi:hypothetical protein
MTDEAISPLRRRMIEDMTIRKLTPKTQQGYIRTIKDFAAFLGRSPDIASFEDVRRFQLHLAASGAHIPILNHTVAALRFFFRVTLRHLGARVGITSVLHSWGSAMTHHPHVHMIVPGGGISLDGERWVACRPGFFLPVRVLSRLFRRLFLTLLRTAQRGRPAPVLRRPCRPRRRAGVRSVSGTAAPSRMGGLCQAPVRRATGRIGLSVAL